MHPRTRAALLSVGLSTALLGLSGPALADQLDGERKVRQVGCDGIEHDSS